MGEGGKGGKGEGGLKGRGGKVTLEQHLYISR